MADEIISDQQYSQIIQQQNQYNNIVKRETRRLQSKKDNMDVERHNADRMILLNNSYKEKQKHYLILLVVVLLTFGISLAIVFLQERLGYSTVVMDWLIIIVVALGIITSFNLFNNILKRDNIDFTKLIMEIPFPEHMLTIPFFLFKASFTIILAAFLIGK